MVFGVKDEEEKAEDILRKARTGTVRAAVAMGHNKGPGEERAGVRARDCEGASGGRVRLGTVV